MVFKNSRILKRLAWMLPALWAVSGTAYAQPAEPIGVALDRYEPPEPGDAFMAVPSPWIGGHLVPRLVVTYDVAYRPLEIEDAAGDMQPLVWGMQVLHANASFALWDRLMIGVGMPFVIDQGPGFPQTTIADGTPNGTTYAMKSGAEVGDLRAGLRGRIYGDYEEPFQIGLGSYFYFPTGPDDSYASEEAFYAHPHLLLGGRARPFIWSASAGTMIRAAGHNPSAFTFGAAAGVLLFRNVLQIGPEVTGQVPFGDWQVHEEPNWAYDAVNAEVLFSATANMFDLFTAGVAAGPGLTNGPGTPDARALLRFGYAPTPAADQPEDADGDGVEDDVDACPEVAGATSEDADQHGCPKPKDSDGDGVTDVDDACPGRQGDASGEPAKNGCPGPQDRDSDGIVDAEDACPEQSGQANDDEIVSGCPRTENEHDCVYEGVPCPDDAGGDRDGDGVINENDACPDQAGRPSAETDKSGCPPGGSAPTPTPGSGPSIGGHEELQDQRIEFDLNMAQIKPDSQRKLDAMARYLQEHDDVSLIEVQGHADDTGPEGFNMALSWARANQVRDALIKRGVKPQILRPMGYGESRPTASNETNSGRQENRRVQLVVKK